MTFFLQIATPAQCMIHEKKDWIEQTWQMAETEINKVEQHSILQNRGPYCHC